MTATFNRNFATEQTSVMSKFVMPLMILAMAGIAIWAYAYAGLIYLGIVNLIPQGTSPLTPVQQFTTGAHMAAAALFALKAIRDEEIQGRITLKAIGYFAVTLVLFGLFFHTLFTAA